MIQLIEAPPRSGKSYYAVNYVMKFVKFDELYSEYVLKDNVLIISNIEGLRVKHWDLVECLKNRPIDEFFSIANFEKIMAKTGKNHVILLIDEAHDFFPSGYKNDKVYSFFAFHGHIGLDIFLMTQGIESMSRMFNPLLEFIVKVTPRSKSVPKTFSYLFYNKAGHFMYSRSLLKKPLVFGAYNSFRKDEQNKPKNALMHWVVIFVVLAIATGVTFKYSIAKVKNMGKGKIASPVNTVAPTVLPATTPVPVLARIAAPGVVPERPVMKNISSLHVLPVITPLQPEKSLSRVIGLVGDVDGKNSKYLLSTGQVTTCKRRLNIGDIFIR